MKSLLIFCILFFCSCLAHAQQFDYTGKYATDFDYQGYLPGPGPIGIGGNPANDDTGYASQFTLSSETNISDLTVIANAYAYENSPTNLTYSLYGNSNNMPSGPIGGSETLEFPVSSSNYSENIDVPFSFDLQPGTYWLAENGTGGEIVTTQQSYIDPPLNSAPVPEPPTSLLLLLGVILFFFLNTVNKLQKSA